MRSFLKWIPTLCLLVLSAVLRGQNDSLPEEQPESFHFRGYVKDLQTAAFSGERGSLLSSNLLHNRLNFKYDFSPAFSARLELRNRLFWGEQVRLTPGFSSQVDYEKGWLDLSWVVVDRPSVVLHTIADRFSVNWQKGRWDIVLGRQRVNWGVATVWNPNDLFNTYNFFDFDYEERPGSDALRVRCSTGTLAGFDLAVSQGKDSASTIVALAYRFNRRGYDFQVFGAWYRDDLALGAGWAGSIGEAGWKGEATWFQPRSTFWDSTGLLSVTMESDYNFESGWYVAGAFLYTSGGSDDAAALDRLPVRQLSAKTPMPFKYSVLGQVARQITPLLTANLSLVYCPGVHAFIIFPVLTYSVSDNWDANLVVQSFFAPEDGHFKNRGNALFFRLKWGF